MNTTPPTGRRKALVMGAGGVAVYDEYWGTVDDASKARAVRISSPGCSRRWHVASCVVTRPC